MKNTFGWARIDIVTMLVCCVFLASFCFSLLMEALQTLVHIDHLDEMHHPLPVLCIGASGILLNVFCYILIGGFTFNQGIFLHVTKSGDVILCRSTLDSNYKELDREIRDKIRDCNNPNSFFLLIFFKILFTKIFKRSFTFFALLLKILYCIKFWIPRWHLLTDDISETWERKKRRAEKSDCRRRLDEVRWQYRKIKAFERCAAMFSVASSLY